MKKITEYLKKMAWPETGYAVMVAVIICMLSVLQGMDSHAAEQGQYTVWLSTGDNLSVQKKRFSVYDKVYLILRFEELDSGEYTISSDWLNPEGQLEQQNNSHTFSLKKQLDYTFFSKPGESCWQEDGVVVTGGKTVATPALQAAR